LQDELAQLKEHVDELKELIKNRKEELDETD